MAITYYKRFRMEIDLDGAVATAGRCREAFVWVPWDESLMEQHAEVKYRSFIGEVDAYVFPCLGDRYGCRRLMCEIRRKPGFLPGATWLIACPDGYVGTVQGVMDHGPIGAIQNVGVISGVSRAGAWPGPGPARLWRVPAGGLAAGLSRGDRRECRGRPALPRRRISAGQDAVQGGRRLKLV